MFESFREVTVDANGVEIFARVGGEGPPLLLLHGYPQTHVMWHKVAPDLARHFTVVAADLRGYGASGKPPTTADHAPYSKRAMAADQVTLMNALGFERFAVAGHDRGGRVAHRLVRDHPERVTRLAVLDIAPTLAMYEATDDSFARAYFHWFFLIQPAPMPERLISAESDLWLLSHMDRKPAGLSPFSGAALAAYVDAFRDPDTVHAACEDYRAAATIDLEHDRADLERRITCPLLALWGSNGVIERSFDCLAEWGRVADDVRGEALPSGHYLPEEAPEAVAERLIAFFTEGA